MSETENEERSLRKLIQTTFSSIGVFVLESPGIRTFLSVMIPVAAGVLSGSFIVEITGPNGLEWSTFYTSHSFYGLGVLCFVMYTYNRLCYQHEKKIHRFLDDDYCRAYMRSQCLPEAAKRYRERIRSGGGGEMQNAMEELEKILRRTGEGS